MLGTLAAIARDRLSRVGCWMWGHDWHKQPQPVSPSRTVRGFEWLCGRCGDRDTLWF